MQFWNYDRDALFYQVWTKKRPVLTSMAKYWVTQTVAQLEQVKKNSFMDESSPTQMHGHL